MRVARTSALLRTSASSDVQRSGGIVSITGFKPFRDRDVLSIKQINYRTEVVQVVTVGQGSYVPTGSTTYTVMLINPAFGREGNVLHTQRKYSYTTPVDITDLGATAALQREAIHGELITRLNANANSFVNAVTLAGGTGFTITDDAGYYPARVNGADNGRRGATNVEVLRNPDGSGFPQTGNLSTTTSAVYAFGEGARLIQDIPVMHSMTGNLISGELEAPVTTGGLYAVSGQRYNAFGVSHLKETIIPTITGVTGYQVWEQMIFVDNGTGTSVTNLAGYNAFEREMHRLITDSYKNDPKSVIEFFDKPIVFQDPLGAAPTGTANTLGLQLSPYGALNRTNIGTQTIVTPVLSANGLLIDQDDTTTEGNHTSANQQTLGVQEFEVGKEEFSVTARVVMGDWTDSHTIIGLRRKAVYDADFNNYTDLAAIGTRVSGAGDVVATVGILNNAATVETASAVVIAADTVSVLLEIKVDRNGVVTALRDGVSFPIYSVGTTALVLDAGDKFIPFYQHVNIGNGNPAVEISEFFAITDANWKL